MFGKIGRVSALVRTTPIVGVALEGLGVDVPRLVDVARRAEAAGVDFVALDDSLDPPEAAGGAPRSRLDALLCLAHVAAATTSVGLVATVTTTHTEPFHVSKNVATLDLVSQGRAGWRVAVSTSAEAALRFGRKDVAPLADLAAEADEVVDVVARLWDSWEDDAVIRDVSTGRYIDRDKLHEVGFEGRWFRVRGPSITPRPPQGQPVVVLDAHEPLAALAAARADVALVVAATPEEARRHRGALRAAAVAAGRAPDDLKVLAASLDLAGSADEVAERIATWWRADAVDGFLLQQTRLDQLVDEVLPHLRARDLLHAPAAGSTLRERLGLARPANRYAPVGAP